MRVLMTTTGFSGHVLPLVPFARACAEAGHEVRVAVPAARAGIVAAAGLEAHAVGDPPAEAVGRVQAAIARLTPEAGLAFTIAEGFARAGAGASLPGVLELVERWRPHVVLRESHEFAGALAAERHGVAHVRLALGLARSEEAVLDAAAAPVDELRAELGLPADPDGERLHAAHCFTLTPSPLEHPPPPCAHATGRFRAADGVAGPLPDWWADRDQPLVYVTLGSIAGSLRSFPGLYRAVVDALAGFPARVLVTVGRDGDPAELGPLPPNVHVERWVPQADVAAQAAAVVCHGGYGSTLSALAHALPLVLLPLFAADQWTTARRVAAVGAGVVLPYGGAARAGAFDHPGREVLDELPGALWRVLHDPGYRGAAERIAAAIGELPPLDAAVGVLEAIAAGQRTPAEAAAR